MPVGYQNGNYLLAVTPEKIKVRWTYPVDCYEIINENCPGVPIAFVPLDSFSSDDEAKAFAELVALSFNDNFQRLVAQRSMKREVANGAD